MKPKVWHRVGKDLIGPMPETPRDNKCIVTLTDYFGKWAEAAPLADKTALGVSRFIYLVYFVEVKLCVLCVCAGCMFWIC